MRDTVDHSQVLEIERVGDTARPATGHGFKMSKTGGGDAAMALFNHPEEVYEPYTAEEESRVVRKIDFLILPQIIVCYAFFYIDKTTLSYAAIFGIRKDLDLYGARYNWLSSIFYFGFLAWAFPTSYLMQRFPIARYLGINIFLWGALLMFQAAAQSFEALAALRALSGAAEACSDPSFLLITSMWYTRRQQPIRMGIWYCANGFGIAIGGLFGYAIGHIKGALPSWRYEFLVIGALCCSWGLVLFFCLPNSPISARFLTERERRIAVERMRADQTGIENKTFKLYQVKEAFSDYKLYFFFVIAIVSNVPNGGISNFGTIIIQGLGFSSLITTVLQVPYGIFIAIILLVCVFVNDWIAKKGYQSRVFMTILFLLPNIGGEFGLQYLPQSSRVARLICYYLTGSYNASFVLVLSLSTANVSGHTKKVTTNAALFLGYCIGNLIGPFFYLSQQAPTYPLGIWSMIVSHLIAILALLTLRILLSRENMSRDMSYAEQKDNDNESCETAFGDLTDKENPNFRARKVKCDESKPLCLRCRKSGRTCAGYPEIPPRARRKDAGTVKRRLYTRSSHDRVYEPYRLAEPNSCPLQFPGHRGSVIARYLSIWPASLGIEGYDIFWGEQVPQAAYVEDAILHALEYLTFAVWETKSAQECPPDNGAPEISLSGLEQYNQSLRALRTRRSQLCSGNDTVLMMCSAIFAMVGTIFDSEERVLHSKWFKYLLNMHLYDQSTMEKSFLNQGDLYKAAIPFYRLLARLILIPSYPKTTKYSVTEANDHLASVHHHDPYDSLEKASGELDQIEDHALDFLSWHERLEPEKPASEIFSVSGQLDEHMEPDWAARCVRQVEEANEAWSKNFLGLEIATHMKLKTPDVFLKLKCYALRIACTVISIRLALTHGEDEVEFDFLDRKFGEVVKQVSYALRCLRDATAADELRDRRTMWTDRSEYIAPLWLVVRMCRNRPIRMEAFRLLKEWPYDENLWSAPIIANVAKTVIQLEDPEAFSRTPNAPGCAKGQRLKTCRLRFHWETNGGSTQLLAMMVLCTNEVRTSRFSVEGVRNPHYISHLRQLYIGSFRPELF